MAGQPGSTTSALPAAAHVVGNAFVNQYYNVLHQSPKVVHRFYTDASRLTRAEAGPDGAVDSVISQSEIHQKVMALDYGDFKAEIITVDSQDSLTGGVLVMVTGSLYKELTGRRNFVQSFFLAPQEKGYFVLNDIFRYVDEDDSQPSRTSSSVTNGLPVPSSSVHAMTEPESSLPTDHEAQELSTTTAPEVEPLVEEIFESAEQVEVSEAEDDNGVEEPSHVETTPVIDEPPSPMAAPSGSGPSHEESSEEAPKKSYASIVSYASILRTKENAGSPVPSNTQNASPKIAAPAVDRQASNSSRPTFAATAQDTPEENSPVENEGSLFGVDGRSVYVKNLPLSISTSQLEEEFGKFGPIRSGGVNVKSQKQGVCYAFVEFEESASAQTAIESSPISIGGRQVYIEEKRPMGPRGGGRGGRLPGIGRSDRAFRSEGLRGRGTLAGRGVSSRGPGQDRDRDAQFKGRGTGPIRSVSGNVGGSLNANGANSGLAGTNGSGAVGANGSGIDNTHKDAQAGNGNRASRRGGGNLAPRNGVVSRGSQHVNPV